MQIIQIPVKEILEDFFFSFASLRDISLLKESIKASGIRTPVYVRSKNGNYQLISGFSRVKIARELQIKEIPAVLIDETVSLEKTLRDILLEHLVSASLNLVEKAKLISILESVKIDPQRIDQTFLPLLELPPDPDLLDKIKKILGWPAEMQTYIETFDLSLKQTDGFRTLSEKEQILLAKLGLQLQIRSVELSEIARMLYEISKKDETDIHTIYRNLDIEKIIKNEDWTRSQKITKIKERLYEKRYPRLHAWNNDLQNLNKTMKLPEKTRLQWDRSLERPGIDLRCQIQSTEDIKTIVEVLSKNENQESIARMLKIV